MSIHHGGGVGIGYSLHAGQVIVADGGFTLVTEPVERFIGIAGATSTSKGRLE